MKCWSASSRELNAPEPRRREHERVSPVALPIAVPRDVPEQRTKPLPICRVELEVRS